MEALAVFWSQYVRRHRGWYVLGVLCLLATNALTVKIPELVGFAVDELSSFQEYVESGGPMKDEQAALGDVFWALLNSAEFLTNH